MSNIFKSKEKILHSFISTQIVAKIVRKSNKNLLTKIQGPEMPFQYILGKISFLGRIGARLLKPINKRQMRKSKHPSKLLEY